MIKFSINGFYAYSVNYVIVFSNKKSISKMYKQFNENIRTSIMILKPEKNNIKDKVLSTGKSVIIEVRVSPVRVWSHALFTDKHHKCLRMLNSIKVLLTLRVKTVIIEKSVAYPYFCILPFIL